MFYILFSTPFSNSSGLLQIDQSGFNPYELNLYQGFVAYYYSNLLYSILFGISLLLLLLGILFNARQQYRQAQQQYLA